MPAFTRAQVTFLQNLTKLSLSADDFAEEVDCNGVRRDAVSNMEVCVTDEVTDATTTPTPTPTPTPVPADGSNGTLIAVIVSAVAILALIVAIVWWMRGRRHSNDPLWSNAELLQRLRLDARELEDIRKLGSGSFGAVWLVRYRESQLLASKRLLTSGRGGIGNTNLKEQQDASVQFIEEIKLVAQLDHPNIVTLVGVAWTYHSDIQALFEFMENGDLRDYLVKSHPSKGSSKNDDASVRLADEMFKLQIACDIADALVYVHSFVPAIVHRDIKSRNVLLSSEWRAKLTDFGTARLQSENHTMTAEVGTGRWLAPEVLTGSKDYGPPADVYAFGVVLSELDTHAIPYDDARSNDGRKQLANVAIMQLVAEGKLRPTFSIQCRPELRALADRCMAQSPEARPVAAVLAYEVRTVMKLVQQESSRE
jgi:serine/threonine protein kinase